MNRFPPSVDPLTFTSLATLLGLLLTNDLTITEQIAISEWFVLISKVLLTNAAWQAVLDERKLDAHRENENINEPFDVDIVKQTLEKMQREIDRLSKGR